MAKLLRVGTRIVNLDNVIHVELDWDDKGGVGIDFNFSVTDDWERCEAGAGRGPARRQMAVIPKAAADAIPEHLPYTMFFDGEEAEALTRFFMDDSNVVVL